jgi:hypothetical protein
MAKSQRLKWKSELEPELINYATSSFGEQYSDFMTAKTRCCVHQIVLLATLPDLVHSVGTPVVAGKDSAPPCFIKSRNFV